MVPISDQRENSLVEFVSNDVIRVITGSGGEFLFISSVTPLLDNIILI